MQHVTEITSPIVERVGRRFSGSTVIGTKPTSELMRHAHIVDAYVLADAAKKAASVAHDKAREELLASAKALQMSSADTVHLRSEKYVVTITPTTRSAVDQQWVKLILREHCHSSEVAENTTTTSSLTCKISVR